jgi:hypothetical protein
MGRLLALVNLRWHITGYRVVVNHTVGIGGWFRIASRLLLCRRRTRHVLIRIGFFRSTRVARMRRGRRALVAFSVFSRRYSAVLSRRQHSSRIDHAA